MAAKVVFLDRVLTGYGPETAEARAVLRNAIEQLAHRAMEPPRANTRANPGPNTQAISSISKPLLIVVAFWLVVIFLTFSLIAPRNGTATFALMISAVSVATAIFLVLELDRPFSGLLRMSNEPMLNVLSQLEKSIQ